jgi:hypothetical protein
VPQLRIGRGALECDELLGGLMALLAPLIENCSSLARVPLGSDTPAANYGVGGAEYPRAAATRAVQSEVYARF